MRGVSGFVLEWCGRAVAARLLPQQPPSGRAAAGQTPAEAAPAAVPSRPSDRLEAGQQPPRGRTGAAVPERLLPAAPASANGSWPVTERMLRPGCRDRVSRSSRGRSRPPEAGAAFPRQELGRSRPPEAGAGQKAALPRQEPRGCRSSNRRSRAAPATVPGAATAGAVGEPRTAPAFRGSGSCNSGGRMPRERRAAPASGRRLLRGSRTATGRTTLGCCTTLVRMIPKDTKPRTNTTRGGRGARDPKTSHFSPSAPALRSSPLQNNPRTSQVLQCAFHTASR